MRASLALLVVTILALASVSCADEASAPTGEEEPAPSGQQGNDARPPTPELSDGVEEIGRQTIVIAPSPGLPYNLTPQELELTVGGATPPCDQLVFAFGWLVTDPREPEDDFGLSWTFTADGQTQNVGRGASGVAEVGCGVLTVTNETTRDISVAVEYVIGESP